MAQTYPKLTLMLASYIRQCSGSLSLPDFTTITLNGGIDGKGAAWHRDAHNMGPTAVTALGRHTGGQLLTQDSDGKVWKQSAHRSVVVFDGRMQHSVADFKEQDRFSIVAFCIDWNKHIAVRKSSLTSLAGGISGSEPVVCFAVVERVATVWWDEAQENMGCKELVVQS